MAKASERVHFGTPQRGRESGSRPARGRLCDQPGCPTVLSTYNSASSCWLHTIPSYARPIYRG
jgi:hypothetical protein